MNNPTTPPARLSQEQLNDIRKNVADYLDTADSPEVHDMAKLLTHIAAQNAEIERLTAMGVELRTDALGVISSAQCELEGVDGFELLRGRLIALDSTLAKTADFSGLSAVKTEELAELRKDRERLEECLSRKSWPMPNDNRGMNRKPYITYTHFAEEDGYPCLGNEIHTREELDAALRAGKETPCHGVNLEDGK